MRALTLVQPGRIEWRQVASPELASPEAALVRPIAVGVCDFDRALVAGRITALPYPIALGHEIVAEVVEVGDRVADVQRGDQVIVPPQVSCGTCAECATGRTNNCEAMPALSNYGLGAGAGNWGGGMSDLLSVPFANAMLVRVPTKLSAQACAAIGCNLVDVYRTIAPYLGRFPSPDVLVVGGHGGTISLYAVAMARALGARRVDFFDDDAARCREADSLGAHPVTFAGELSKAGYQIVIDGSLMPERLSSAVGALARDGVCTTMWLYPESVSLPLTKMFTRSTSLTTGQPHARALIEPVLELISAGSISSTAIPVDVLPWESADATFAAGTRKQIFAR